MTHSFSTRRSSDLLLFFKRDENQRVVGRLQGIDKAHAIPFARAQQVALGDEEVLAANAHVQRELMIAHRLGRRGDLAVRAVLEIAQKGVADGARPEERRVGKACVSTFRSRWST